MNLYDLFNEEKVRLDPHCWHNKKIGNPKTKMKGGVRVNNCVPAESVEESTGQPLSVQQLATISDAALDDAYGYGRSTPGNTFGWQANLASAAYAKQMIDKGVTDIIAISDAVHKGWWSVAQKFVDDPDQFSDTEKLRADGKFDKKMADRKAQMVPFNRLTKDQQDIDTVVARALLQAIRGEQQPGMAEGYVPINIYKGPTSPAPEPKRVEPEPKHKYVDNQADHEQYRQAREKYLYNVVGKLDREVLNPEPLKGLTAAEEFMKQKGLGRGNADLVQVSTLRFHATGIDASGKRVVSEPLIGMKNVRDFYKQHGINPVASTTDLTTTDDGDVTEGVMYGAENLHVGDPVVITGNVEFEGKTGDIVDFGQDKRFVVVNLYNHGRQSFHSSDVSYNDYAGSDDMDADDHDDDMLNEKSVSQAQFRTMAGAAHNPEFARKVGISQDVAQEFNRADKHSNYKKLPARATEGEQQPGADYIDPPEDKDPDQYGDDYQAMVARVKKLAGLGPMKTVYDPNKRVYRNMPTAVQPKK